VFASLVEGSTVWDLMFIVMILVYPLPLIIASYREHPHLPGIMLLNLALGWTIVGWIVALRWSLWTPTAGRRRRITQAASTP
jgi:hypothetical protein